MIALIQRVTSAQVAIAQQVVGQIDQGLLVLLGVEAADDETKARKLADKVISYRVFNDQHGKMNLNLRQVRGKLLVVSQFTLAADTNNGLRPSFSRGAPPDQAEALYQYFSDYCRQQAIITQNGRFAADMQVSLVNDGPVTFWLNC